VFCHFHKNKNMPREQGTSSDPDASKHAELEIFEYENVMKAPKQVREWTFDSITYQLHETSGFIRLYFSPYGYHYWMAQAMSLYRVPDWKLHVSVAPAHLPQTWNVLSKLFIEKRVLSAMKVEILGKDWPAHMLGREIAIYMYRYSDVFTGEEFLHLGLQSAFEQDVEFWHSFIEEAESRLEAEDIVAGPLAEGDLRMGRYMSLRNESFCRMEARWETLLGDYRNWSRVEDYIYPPNDAGWNAAGHECPFV
jgi:hypothetical protein